MYTTRSSGIRVNWQELGGYNTGTHQNYRQGECTPSGKGRDTPLQITETLSTQARLAEVLLLNESSARAEASIIRRFIRRIRCGVRPPNNKGVHHRGEGYVKKPSIALRPEQLRIGAEPVITEEIIAKGLANYQRDDATGNNYNSNSVHHSRGENTCNFGKAFAIAACVILAISVTTCGAKGCSKDIFNLHPKQLSEIVV